MKTFFLLCCLATPLAAQTVRLDTTTEAYGAFPTEAVAWADRLGWWAGQLGLTDWQIVVRVDRLPVNVAANTRWQLGDRRAIVTFDPLKLRHVVDVDPYIRHEVIHLFLDPWIWLTWTLADSTDYAMIRRLDELFTYYMTTLPVWDLIKEP